MKYILLMSGSKAGVAAYRAWPKKDIDAHMAVLISLNHELAESGEFIATQGLAAPHEAKVVRGLKEGMPQQRAALYSSGLGSEPGLFLDMNCEELIDSLAKLHAAFLIADGQVAGQEAVRFAKIVLDHPFFGVRKLPDAWETVLAQWIAGVSAADILEGRKGHDFNRMQIFLQDAIAFKLVWAAEAVRVQAVALAHARSPELGEGPALAFTYGVSNQPAALLCQMGLASRTAALWAVEKANGKFKNTFGAKLWLSNHEQLLAQRDFWQTDDQHLPGTVL